MQTTFEPRLDILPESQLRLWPELDVVPSDFVLYGGTGLALQLGHRFSEDFDFFSTSGFDPARLQSRLPFFRDLNRTNADAWLHYKTDNLEAFVDRGGPVKVAFFGGLDTLQRVKDPLRAAGSRVRVASLIDLAGMKMRVIQVRGSWKDYVDIHALAAHGVDLPTGLQFYGDGTLDRVPESIRRDLTRWAHPAQLPVFRPRRGLSPGGMEL